MRTRTEFPEAVVSVLWPAIAVEVKPAKRRAPVKRAR